MTLRSLNNLLLVLIILINGYVIAAPFLPNLLFRLANPVAKRQQLTQNIHHHSAASTKPATSQANQITIPSLLLNTPLYEGTLDNQYKTLDKGIWRWPASSTPDHGGNTVLIGHRFTYTNPRGIFYFLNKLALGDEIGVTWNNKPYLYKVISIKQVPPTDTSIEANTASPELTLFTCTPLWLPKDRLVVVASLESRP